MSTEDVCAQTMLTAANDEEAKGKELAAQELMHEEKSKHAARELLQRIEGDHQCDAIWRVLTEGRKEASARRVERRLVELVRTKEERLLAALLLAERVGLREFIAADGLETLIHAAWSKVTGTGWPAVENKKVAKHALRLVGRLALKGLVATKHIVDVPGGKECLETIMRCAPEHQDSLRKLLSVALLLVRIKDPDARAKLAYIVDFVIEANTRRDDVKALHLLGEMVVLDGTAAHLVFEHRRWILHVLSLSRHSAAAREAAADVVALLADRGYGAKLATMFGLRQALRALCHAGSEAAAVTLDKLKLPLVAAWSAASPPPSPLSFAPSPPPSPPPSSLPSPPGRKRDLLSEAIELMDVCAAQQPAPLALKKPRF